MSRWTALAIIEAHLLDLSTFLIAAALWGVGDEINPAARLVWTAGGPLGVIVFKLGLTLVFVGLVARVPPRRWKSPLIVAFVLVGLLGCGANCLYLLAGLSAR